MELKSKSGTCLHNFDLFLTDFDEGGSAALQVGSVYSLRGACDWRSLAIRHSRYQPRCLQNSAHVHLSSNVEHELVSCWLIRWNIGYVHIPGCFFPFQLKGRT